jgi:hypothetical protein
MSDRSVLQFRVKPHFHPDRQEDVVVEVLRDGEVAATIYGSREGVHIVSERLQPDRNLPFFMLVNETPSCVIPLLKAGEECPWCLAGMAIMRPCPVCRKK